MWILKKLTGDMLCIKDALIVFNIFLWSFGILLWYFSATFEDIGFTSHGHLHWQLLNHNLDWRVTILYFDFEFPYDSMYKALYNWKANYELSFVVLVSKVLRFVALISQLSKFIRLVNDSVLLKHMYDFIWKHLVQLRHQHKWHF